MHPFPGLSPRMSREAFAELCRALPPPIDDSQDSRDARDMLAMVAVAAFRPADITEALMVVEVVAIEAHVREALREAGEHRADIKMVQKCRAQATAMMRQKQAALRMLHEYQAARPPAPVEQVQADTAQPAAEAPVDRPSVADRPKPRPLPRWMQIPPATGPAGLDPYAADQVKRLARSVAWDNPAERYA